MPGISGLSDASASSCSAAACLISWPSSQSRRASAGVRSKPTSAGVDQRRRSSRRRRRRRSACRDPARRSRRPGGSTKAGWLTKRTCSTLPSRQSQVTLIRPAGRLEGDLGDRLGHRQNPGLQQHGRHADRVGTRHRRVLRGLQDDVAHLRLRMVRRDEDVGVVVDCPARLEQDQLAQLVAVILRDRPAWRRRSRRGCRPPRRRSPARSRPRRGSRRPGERCSSAAHGVS